MKNATVTAQQAKQLVSRANKDTFATAWVIAEAVRFDSELRLIWNR